MEPFQVNSASSKDHQCNCCQLLSPRQHSVLQKWDLAKRNRLFSRTAAGIILRIASKSLMGSSVGSPKFWEGQKFGGGQNVWLCTSNSMFVCDAASQSTKWLDMLNILGTSPSGLPPGYVHITGTIRMHLVVRKNGLKQTLRPGSTLQ